MRVGRPLDPCKVRAQGGPDVDERAYAAAVRAAEHRKRVAAGDVVHRKVDEHPPRLGVVVVVLGLPHGPHGQVVRIVLVSEGGEDADVDDGGELADAGVGPVAVPHVPYAEPVGREQVAVCIERNVAEYADVLVGGRRDGRREAGRVVWSAGLHVGPYRIAEHEQRVVRGKLVEPRVRDVALKVGAQVVSRDGVRSRSAVAVGSREVRRQVVVPHHVVVDGSHVPNVACKRGRRGVLYRRKAHRGDGARRHKPLFAGQHGSGICIQRGCVCKPVQVVDQPDKRD